MNETLKKIGSKVLGTFVGAMTGIGAGFLPGYYYFLEKGDGSNYVGVLAYLSTLPFLMAWQMVKGAVEGAKKGIMAGWVYPQTLNEQFQIPIRNQEILNVLAVLEKTQSQDLLSANEQTAFEALLKEKNLSLQKQDKLARQYAHYLDYLNLTKSTLTGASLKEIAHPLIINIDGKSYLCEQEKFKTLVEDCQKQRQPIILSNHVVSMDDMGSFKNSLPETIIKFITKVRSLFNSLHLINKALGLKPDSSRFDLSLIPEKKVQPIGLLTFPSSEATIQNQSLEAENKNQQVIEVDSNSERTQSVGMKM